MISIFISIVLFVYIIYKKLYSNKTIALNEFQIDKNICFENRFKECPPFYPNGWLPVLESRDLKKSTVKPVFAFGNDLIAFRGVSGKVYVMDAYCPHLGANLGVGGTVVGEEIKCPFHGWTFNNDGKCIHVPGIEDSSIPKAQIKVWHSLEVNGFICVWNHSEGEEPNWTVEPIKEIANNQYTYMGRIEHRVDCHAQEILENIGDSAHFNQVHKVPEFLAIVGNKGQLYELILKYFYYKHSTAIKAGPEPHILDFEFSTTVNYGPIKFVSHVEGTVFGPVLAHLKTTIFGKKSYQQILIAVISEGPTSQRLVEHIYAKEFNPFSYFFIKLSMNFNRLQLDRDNAIWNKKKWIENPILAKNDSSIKFYRRWLKQFYTGKDKTMNKIDDKKQ